MSASPKMVERIRRCLALGAGVGPEAATARDKAHKLAEQYGVDLVQLAKEAAARGESTAFNNKYVAKSGSVWRATLAWGVARYTNCEMVRQNWRSSDTIFWVVGTAEDFATWRTLFERAEGEIEQEAAAYLDRVRDTSDWQYSGRASADSFRKGAAQGFGVRLKTYKDEVARSTQGQATAAVEAPAPTTGESSTGLVLVSRALAVKTASEKYHPKTRSVRVSGGSDSSARADGFRFGSKLGVHKGSIR